MMARLRDVPICIRVTGTMLVMMLVFLGGLLLWASREQGRIAVGEARAAAERAVGIAVTGLTVVMGTGETEAQTAFLERLRRGQGTDSVQVIPADSVARQYDRTVDAASTDPVARQVLASGIPHFGVETRDGRLTYRAVVPVRAQASGGKDCLTCHQAERGSVLGAVSLGIGLDQVRAATRAWSR